MLLKARGPVIMNHCVVPVTGTLATSHVAKVPVTGTFRRGGLGVRGIRAILSIEAVVNHVIRQQRSSDILHAGRC